MDKKPRLGSDPLEWVKGGEIMNKKWISVFLIFVLIIFGFSLRSIADCKSDCQDAYDSEVDSCKTQYDDPDDADLLKMCIDNLESEYQSCVDECENLDQADCQEPKYIFSASMLLNPNLTLKVDHPQKMTKFFREKRVFEHPIPF